MASEYPADLAIAFGDGCNIDTFRRAFGGFVGLVISLTVDGTETEYELCNVVQHGDDWAFDVTNFRDGIVPESERTYIPLSVVEQITIH